MPFLAAIAAAYDGRIMACKPRGKQVEKLASFLVCNVDRMPEDADMHARLTQIRDRRINGRHGTTRTLCGAEPTNADASVAEFKRAMADPGKWNPCPACAAKIQTKERQ